MDLPGIALVPLPIEVFGHEPELDDEVARQVFRLGLAPLLPPEAEEGAGSSSPMMIRASEPPMKVRLSDESANYYAVRITVISLSCQCAICHESSRRSVLKSEHYYDTLNHTIATEIGTML